MTGPGSPQCLRAAQHAGSQPASLRPYGACFRVPCTQLACAMCTWFHLCLLPTCCALQACSRVAYLLCFAADLLRSSLMEQRGSCRAASQKCSMSRFLI